MSLRLIKLLFFLGTTVNILIVAVANFLRILSSEHIRGVKKNDWLYSVKNQFGVYYFHGFLSTAKIVKISTPQKVSMFTVFEISPDTYYSNDNNLSFIFTEVFFITGMFFYISDIVTASCCNSPWQPGM